MLRSILLVLTTFTFATSAHADDSIADLVRLKDGSMVRGVILEVSPESHVLVQLPSGELQRFGTDEIEYAGAADGAPAPRVEPPAPGRMPGVDEPARDIRLRVFGAQEGLTLHWRRNTVRTGYYGRFSLSPPARLCSAPCEAMIEKGAHQWIVEDSRGRRRALRDRPYIRDDADLRVSFVSRRRQRITRWLLFGAFSVAGVGMVAAGTRYTCDDWECGRNIPLAAAGGGVLAAGLTTMFVAIFTFDRTRLELYRYGQLGPLE